MPEEKIKRVVIAGATGYLGKYAVRAFKQQGYYVRVLTRSEARLYEPGPFSAPALTQDDFDDVFVGEITQPETLTGLLDGIDLVFSSVGISRQRDGLTFEQVDYQGNKNLIDLADFIVTAGEIDGVGPQRGSTTYAVILKPCMQGKPTSELSRGSSGAYLGHSVANPGRS